MGSCLRSSRQSPRLHAIQPGELARLDEFETYCYENEIVIPGDLASQAFYHSNGSTSSENAAKMTERLIASIPEIDSLPAVMGQSQACPSATAGLRSYLRGIGRFGQARQT